MSQRRSNRAVYRIKKFDGGIQNFTSPFNLDEGECLMAKNVDVRAPGKITKALGFSQVGETGGTGNIKGIFVFSQEDGTHDLYKLHATTLYRWSGSAWVSHDTSFTNNSTDKVEGITTFTDSEERLYIASGFNDKIGFTNGTTYAEITEDLYGKHIEYFKARIFVGNCKVNGTESPVRVSYSDVLADTFDLDNHFFEDVGEPITGLKSYGGKLWVFSENSLSSFNIDDDETETLNTLAGNFGTPSAKSIVKMWGYLIWYNRDGIYMYAGTGLPTLISRKIQGWIDVISSDSDVAAFVDEFGRYNLWIGDATYEGDSYTNVVLVYDLLSNSWVIRDNCPFVCGVRVPQTGGFLSYAGDTDNDKVWLVDDGNDNDGSAISSVWESPLLDAELPEEEKHFYEINITHEPTGNAEYVTVKYKLDGDTSWNQCESTNNNVDLSGSDAFETTKVYFPKEVTGKYIQIQLSHSSSSGGFEIYEIDLEFDVITDQSE